MVLTLIFAHILGDFPFQLNWMIREKKKLWVLALHASIHFLLMVLLVGEARLNLWPYLLLLSLIHMGQDKIKISLTNRYPKLTIPFFIIDQIFHLLAIYGLATWVSPISTGALFIKNPEVVIMLISYLLITYVLFIVEKVFYHSDPGYQISIDQAKYSRMIVRGGLISIFFLLRESPVQLFSGLIFNPYPTSKYRFRAIFTDIIATLIMLVLMYFAIGTR